MLGRQRQEVILDEVRTTGGVRVSELVERLGVSDMTIRRDIEALAVRGLVTRVHGGATAAGSSVDEPGVHGIDAEAGFTTPNLAEAETNRALVAGARRVAVVADNSKWGVVGLSERRGAPARRAADLGKQLREGGAGGMSVTRTYGRMFSQGLRRVIPGGAA